MNRSLVWKLLGLSVIVFILCIIFLRPKSLENIQRTIQPNQTEDNESVEEVSETKADEASVQIEEVYLPAQILSKDECPTKESIHRSIENLNSKLLEGFKDHCMHNDESTQCSNFSVMDEAKGVVGPLNYEVYEIIPKAAACEFLLILTRKGLHNADETDSVFKLDYEAFVTKKKEVRPLLDIGSTIHEVKELYVGTFDIDCGLQNLTTVLSKKGEVIYEGPILKTNDPEIKKIKFLPPQNGSFFQAQLEYSENPHPVGQNIMVDQVSAVLEFSCQKDNSNCAFVTKSEQKKEVPVSNEACN